MKDPVTTRNGLTYERSAIEAQRRRRIGSGRLYPNRALKSIIDEAVEMTDDSLLAGVKRLTNSVCHNISFLVDSTATSNNPECLPPLPEAYHCPITFGLMHDPVIDPEGNTFDRIAVENWIHAHGTSPITRTKMSIKDLYPNLAVAELLKEEMNRSDESMHPAIKVWKDEAPPERLDPSERLQSNASTAPRDEEYTRTSRVFASSLCMATLVLYTVILMWWKVDLVFVLIVVVPGLVIARGLWG